METLSIVGWVTAGVLATLCALSHARAKVLEAHTARLRDRGEYRYTVVNQ